MGSVSVTDAATALSHTQPSRAPWLSFVLTAAAALVLDLWTKSLALDHLQIGETVPALGGWLPLTLHFNTGGLWGLGGGWISRWVFLPVTLLALWVVAQLYRDSHRGQWLRRLTLPLIAAGALGNLVDRLRWEKGVVDFLGPFDLGFMTWPIFNVADMAISVSTVLLVLTLWHEGHQAAKSRRAAVESTVTEPAASSSVLD